MNKKTIISRVILVIGITVIGIIVYKNYFYFYLLLSDTPKYPTGQPLENMDVYKIDPETISTSLDQGKTDVFMSTDKNPIYDNVPPLDRPGSSFLVQGDYQKIVNALHQFVWKESLKDWHLYSTGLAIAQCKDISQVNSVGFQFYQRQSDWYYVVHAMTIDLEYGYVYAGDNNGHYTGQWKDIDLNNVMVNSFDKAMLIAEQNGGEEARLAVKEDQKCTISINLSPQALFDSSWPGWGWEITYWTDDGASLLFGIIIDPYTGNYKILKSKQVITLGGGLCEAPRRVFFSLTTPTTVPTSHPAATATATRQPTSAPTDLPTPLPGYGETTINYTYDPLYRLTEANYSTGDYYHYTYDAVGNRLQQTTMVNGLSSVVDYGYDNANRLTSVNGTTYTWDNNGNLLNDGVKSYSYNKANQLMTVSGQQLAISYNYNGLGDRLQEIVNGQTTTFAMDLNTGLTQALSDGTNTYIYGNGRIAQANGTGTEYFLPDALGSVRQITNADAQITYTSAYDPYGVVTNTYGASQTAYGYTGEYTANDLMYLRARYYAPSMGRFLTRDTWGGDANSPLSFNQWMYVEGNPVNKTDLSGQAPDCRKFLDELQMEKCESVYMPPSAKNYNIVSPPQNITFIGKNITYPEIYRWGKPTSPGTYQSQFIGNKDPYATSHKWPRFPESDDNLHTGLCGQGSIAGILATIYGKYSLNAVVDNFVDYRAGYPDYTGLGTELAPFINQTYDFLHADAQNTSLSAWSGLPGSSGLEKMPYIMRDWLARGKFLIAGVLVGNSTGILNNGNAAHWIVISGVSKEWDYSWPNEIESSDKLSWKWIRIYNPFNNFTEYYTWSDFKKAWGDNGYSLLGITYHLRPSDRHHTESFKQV